MCTSIAHGRLSRAVKGEDLDNSTYSPTIVKECEFLIETIRKDIQKLLSIKASKGIFKTSLLKAQHSRINAMLSLEYRIPQSLLVEMIFVYIDVFFSTTSMSIQTLALATLKVLLPFLTNATLLCVAWRPWFQFVQDIYLHPERGVTQSDPAKFAHFTKDLLAVIESLKDRFEADIVEDLPSLLMDGLNSKNNKLSCLLLTGLFISTDYWAHPKMPAEFIEMSMKVWLECDPGDQAAYNRAFGTAVTAILYISGRSQVSGGRHAFDIYKILPAVMSKFMISMRLPVDSVQLTSSYLESSSSLKILLDACPNKSFAWCIAPYFLFSPNVSIPENSVYSDDLVESFKFSHPGTTPPTLLNGTGDSTVLGFLERILRVSSPLIHPSVSGNHFRKQLSIVSDIMDALEAFDYMHFAQNLALGVFENVSERAEAARKAAEAAKSGDNSIIFDKYVYQYSSPMDNSASSWSGSDGPFVFGPKYWVYPPSASGLNDLKSSPGSLPTSITRETVLRIVDIVLPLCIQGLHATSLKDVECACGTLMLVAKYAPARATQAYVQLVERALDDSAVNEASLTNNILHSLSILTRYFIIRRHIISGLPGILSRCLPSLDAAAASRSASVLKIFAAVCEVLPVIHSDDFDSLEKLSSFPGSSDSLRLPLSCGQNPSFSGIPYLDDFMPPDAEINLVKNYPLLSESLLCPRKLDRSLNQLSSASGVAGFPTGEGKEGVAYSQYNALNVPMFLVHMRPYAAFGVADYDAAGNAVSSVPVESYVPPSDEDSFLACVRNGRTSTVISDPTTVSLFQSSRAALYRLQDVFMDAVDAALRLVGRKDSFKDKQGRPELSVAIEGFFAGLAHAASPTLARLLMARVAHWLSTQGAQDNTKYAQDVVSALSNALPGLAATFLFPVLLQNCQRAFNDANQTDLQWSLRVIGIVAKYAGLHVLHTSISPDFSVNSLQNPSSSSKAIGVTLAGKGIGFTQKSIDWDDPYCETLPVVEKHPNNSPLFHLSQILFDLLFKRSLSARDDFTSKSTLGVTKKTRKATAKCLKHLLQGLTAQTIRFSPMTLYSHLQDPNFGGLSFFGSQWFRTRPRELQANERCSLFASKASETVTQLTKRCFKSGALDPKSALTVPADVAENFSQLLGSASHVSSTLLRRTLFQRWCPLKLSTPVHVEPTQADLSVAASLINQFFSAPLQRLHTYGASLPDPAGTSSVESNGSNAGENDISADRLVADVLGVLTVCRALGPVMSDSLGPTGDDVVFSMGLSSGYFAWASQDEGKGSVVFVTPSTFSSFSSLESLRRVLMHRLHCLIQGLAPSSSTGLNLALNHRPIKSVDSATESKVLRKLLQALCSAVRPKFPSLAYVPSPSLMDLSRVVYNVSHINQLIHPAFSLVHPKPEWRSKSKSSSFIRKVHFDGSEEVAGNYVSEVGGGAWLLPSEEDYKEVYSFAVDQLQSSSSSSSDDKAVFKYYDPRKQLNLPSSLIGFTVPTSEHYNVSGGASFTISMMHKRWNVFLPTCIRALHNGLGTSPICGPGFTAEQDAEDPVTSELSLFNPDRPQTPHLTKSPEAQSTESVDEIVTVDKDPVEDGLESRELREGLQDTVDWLDADADVLPNADIADHTPSQGKTEEERQRRRRAAFERLRSLGDQVPMRRHAFVRSYTAVDSPGVDVDMTNAAGGNRPESVSPIVSLKTARRAFPKVTLDVVHAEEAHLVLLTANVAFLGGHADSSVASYCASLLQQLLSTLPWLRNGYFAHAIHSLRRLMDKVQAAPLSTASPIIIPSSSGPLDMEDTSSVNVVEEGVVDIPTFNAITAQLSRFTRISTLIAQLKAFKPFILSSPALLHHAVTTIARLNSITTLLPKENVTEAVGRAVDFLADLALSLRRPLGHRGNPIIGTSVVHGAEGVVRMYPGRTISTLLMQQVPLHRGLNRDELYRHSKNLSARSPAEDTIIRNVVTLPRSSFVDSQISTYDMESDSTTPMEAASSGLSDTLSPHLIQGLSDQLCRDASGALGPSAAPLALGGGSGSLAQAVAMLTLALHPIPPRVPVSALHLADVPSFPDSGPTTFLDDLKLDTISSGYSAFSLSQFCKHSAEWEPVSQNSWLWAQSAAISTDSAVLRLLGLLALRDFLHATVRSMAAGGPGLSDGALYTFQNETYISQLVAVLSETVSMSFVSSKAEPSLVCTADERIAEIEQFHKVHNVSRSTCWQRGSTGVPKSQVIMLIRSLLLAVPTAFGPLLRALHALAAKAATADPEARHLREVFLAEAIGGALHFLSTLTPMSAGAMTARCRGSSAPLGSLDYALTDGSLPELAKDVLLSVGSEKGPEAVLSVAREHDVFRKSAPPTLAGLAEAQLQLLSVLSVVVDGTSTDWIPNYRAAVANAFDDIHPLRLGIVARFLAARAHLAMLASVSGVSFPTAEAGLPQLLRVLDPSSSVKSRNPNESDSSTTSAEARWKALYRAPIVVDLSSPNAQVKWIEMLRALTISLLAVAPTQPSRNNLFVTQEQWNSAFFGACDSGLEPVSSMQRLHGLSISPTEPLTPSSSSSILPAIPDDMAAPVVAMGPAARKLLAASIIALGGTYELVRNANAVVCLQLIYFQYEGLVNISGPRMVRAESFNTQDRADRSSQNVNDVMKNVLKGQAFSSKLARSVSYVSVDRSAAEEELAARFATLVHLGALAMRISAKEIREKTSSTPLDTWSSAFIDSLSSLCVCHSLSPAGFGSVMTLLPLLLTMSQQPDMQFARSIENILLYIGHNHDSEPGLYRSSSSNRSASPAVLHFQRVEKALEAFGWTGETYQSPSSTKYIVRRSDDILDRGDLLVSLLDNATLPIIDEEPTTAGASASPAAPTRVVLQSNILAAANPLVPSPFSQEDDSCKGGDYTVHWGVRALAVRLLSNATMRNFVSLPRIVVDRSRSAIIARLTDRAPHVAQSASRALVPLLLTAPAARQVALATKFVTFAQTKVPVPVGLPADAMDEELSVQNSPRGTQDPAKVKYLRMLRRRLGGTLGLAALVKAYPFTVPPHLPEFVAALAIRASDTGSSGKCAKSTISEFRSSHHETWDEQKLIFSEDQLNDILSVTPSSNYFA